MASVSSCEYKVCRSIGRESHFRFSLWLCLPRSSSDLHPTASPPATPAGGTPPISAGLSRPPRSGPLCTSGFDGGPPAPRALPCTGRERPGAWLTLCLAEPDPRSTGAHCREGKQRTNDSSGAVFVRFSGLRHTPENSHPELAWRSDGWCAFQQLSAKCPRWSRAPCTLLVLNILPRFPPAHNSDRFPHGFPSCLCVKIAAPSGLIIDDSFSSCKFHHFAEIPLVLMGISDAFLTAGNPAEHAVLLP